MRVSRHLSILTFAAFASAQTHVNSGLGSYSYYGCVTDTSPRTLFYGQTSFGTPVTVEHCVSLCSAAGYIYAGLEYYRECYCDNSTSSASITAPEGDCNLPCDNNGAEACGGSNRLSLYSLGGVAPAPPAIQQNPGNSYGYYACYTDSTTTRTLRGTYELANTVTECVNFCSNSSTVYAYAGLENGNECYCSQILATSTVSTGCTTFCSGNHRYACGGSLALSVYKAGTGSGKLPGPSVTSSADNSARSAASASSASLASYRSQTAISYQSRVSYVSASKASASSAKVSRDAAASQSLSNARATKSLIQAAHVSSLSAIDLAHSRSLASQRSTKSQSHSAFLASSRTSRLQADASHSSELAAARASKSSVNSAHSASLASVDSLASQSRASVSSFKAAAAAAKTTSLLSASMTSTSSAQ